MRGLGLGLGLSPDAGGGGGGSPYVNPEVTAYVAAVSATGSVVNPLHAAALDIFVSDLKTAGIFAKVRRWNPRIGSALAGVAVCLVANVGSPTDSLNNYVAGEWNEITGLQGNATSTWAGTGWVIDFAATPNHWLGVSYNGAAPGATRYLLGVTDGDSSCAVSLASTTAPLAIGKIAGLTAQVNAAVSLNTGVWSVMRDSTTNLVLYKNNVSQGSSATAVGTINNGTQELVVGARNNTGGVKSGWLGAFERINGYIFADALSAGERTAMQTAWAAFNTAIGR